MEIKRNKSPKTLNGMRKKFLALYYENPNYCLECGKMLVVSETENPAYTKGKKFCDHSCATTYNNKIYPKRPKHMDNPNCKVCGQEIKINRGPSDRLSLRTYCDSCLLERRREVMYKNNDRAPENGFHSLTKDQVLLSEDIPKYRRRTRIAQHAQVVYRWSGKSYICLACGYTLHVNICHIKDIKDFDGDALMSEINHPDNLIALCPTHHWEFDHGFWHLPENQVCDQ